MKATRTMHTMPTVQRRCGGIAPSIWPGSGDRTSQRELVDSRSVFASAGVGPLLVMPARADWRGRLVGSTTATSVAPLLGVLRQHELQSAAVLGNNVSWYRAAVRAAPAQEQAVPRRIMQTGRTFHHAMQHHAHWMRTWWVLNPEYEYSFFGDVHALP